MCRFKCIAVLSLSVLFLNACYRFSPDGQLPENCSGIPGDLAVPATPQRLIQASHGLGAAGSALRVQAVARPFGLDPVPLLYVFDDEGAYVSSWNQNDSLLVDPIFAELEKTAFWFEVVDGSGYMIPELDRCSIVSMLDEPFSFKAPQGGLLFVQFTAAECEECELIGTAIQAVSGLNPEVPVAWVQIEVPAAFDRAQAE